MQNTSNFIIIIRTMEESLRKENEELRKRNKELEEEVKKRKCELDKFKESSRYQVYLYHISHW